MFYPHLVLNLGSMLGTALAVQKNLKIQEHSDKNKKNKNKYKKAKDSAFPLSNNNNKTTTKHFYKLIIIIFCGCNSKYRTEIPCKSDIAGNHILLESG